MQEGNGKGAITGMSLQLTRGILQLDMRKRFRGNNVGVTAEQFSTRSPVEQS
jgi:hypothetical protein